MSTVDLSKWQTQVWEDPHRFKVVNVGRRSGKTVMSVIKMLTLALEDKLVIWYVAPTYKQAKNIAWALLKEYAPTNVGIKFNETELKAIFPNGAEIHLKGADNPDSLRGVHIDFAIFDEVAFFTNWIIVWEALRPVLVDSKADCWFISTPRGFNHFHQLFLKENNDDDYKSFHYTSYDNPYIDKEEIEKTRQEMDERSFEQEFMAVFNKPAGTVYAEWPLNNFKEVPYDPSLPVHVSLDFGVNDPTSIIWFQPTGSEYHVIDYYEASNANIEHFASVIHSKPYKSVELFTGDAAGKARNLTTGTSPIEELALKGIHVRTTDGLRLNDQIRATHKIIKSLYVNSLSEGCERFRDCLLNYRYPVFGIEKSSKTNFENEVPIHDEYSHAMRALEYYVVNSRGITNEPVFIPKMTGFGGEEIGGYQI